jgi:hypothetical protein
MPAKIKISEIRFEERGKYETAKQKREAAHWQTTRRRLKNSYQQLIL